MSGGSGERLWPISRGHRPKQLLTLFKNSDSILIQTLKLAQSISPRVCVQVSKLNAKDIESHLLRHAAHMPELIVEEKSFDSAYAFLYQAALTCKESSDTILVIMPSDHIISDEKSYAKALNQGIKAISDYPEKICLVGCEAQDPSSRFGYILPGDKLSQSSYKVAAFIEKPEHTKAQSLIDQGALWNSGIIIAQAKTLLASAKKALPHLELVHQELLSAALELRSPKLSSTEKSSKLSFDYILLEQAQNLCLIKSKHKLQDIGSIQSLEDALARKPIAQAHASNNTVHSFTQHPKSYAVLGADDLELIDFDDALLIAHKDSLDEMRLLTQALKESYGSHALENCLVQERPWGSWKILFEQPGLKIKLIHVDAGKRLSLQSHKHRHETWLIISGRAGVIVDDEHKELSARESISIKPGQKHRLAALGSVDLKLIEIAQGDYIDEDDIERFDDDWHRD